MTAYCDFVLDFPKRCLDLLDLFGPKAQAVDREVTLLLSVAATGFVIPFERLLPKDTHPATESKDFREFARQLDRELSRPFEKHPLSASTAKSWSYGEIDSASGDPDAWVGKCNPIGSRDGRSILRAVRNALAHGSVFTKGNPGIDQLVFLSERRDDNDTMTGYKVVAVGPTDFEKFLRAWFETLQTAKAGTLLHEADLARRAA
jgi:hypothetical protein